MTSAEIRRQAVKDMIYGGLREISSDPQIVYYCEFDPRRSEIHEQAREICLDIFLDFVAKVRAAELSLDKEQSRRAVINHLSDR